MSRLRTLKHFLYWSWLPLLFGFLPVSNQSSVSVKPEPCHTTNEVFLAGEELVYKVYYNWNFVWMSAGEVVFRVTEEGNEYHFSARGRTYSSYDWFFKVRDNYDSYVSKENLLPRLSIRDIEEGDYKRYERVTFNHSKQQAVSKKGVTRDETNTETFEMDGCMHDILSILYYMRNINVDNMRPGGEIPIKFFFDREIYPLKVKYLGKEDKTRIKGQGQFKTHKISPQLIAGEVFKEGDEMTVYVSQDKNKIPLMIESPVSVGSVKVVLKSWKGLKYDLSSKIE
ncbi:MAG: DUF3108 domain-containing protein [Saprospiraceae bacterium]